MNDLLTTLATLAPIDGQVEEHLLPLIGHRTLRPKELLLRPPQVARCLYFVEEGLLRSFQSDETQEVTTCFFLENNWIIVPSFLSQRPSMFCLQALERTQLSLITYSDLRALIGQFPAFSLHWALVLEQCLAHPHPLSSRFHTHDTASRKYAMLLQYCPTLVQRVPVKYLATYLGMTANYFSFTRANFARSLDPIP